MNKFLRKLLLFLYPFYPFWAWISYSVTHLTINKIVSVVLLPFALYFLFKKNKNFPKYLKFFGMFTIFHLLSVFYNNLVPANTTVGFFIISDPNVYAFFLLIIIENIKFDQRSINKLTRNIFYIVIISLVFSVIQINNPRFFLSSDITDDSLYLEQSRNFSIFSWTSLNSLGISFPILISILLSVYAARQQKTYIITICGIVVSFLTKARYVMISAIIAFSQLLLSGMVTFKKRTFYIISLLGIIVVLALASDQFGIDTSKIIEDRILEKKDNLGSASARVASYYVFLLKFPENPFLGVGPATRDDVLELLHGSAPLIHVGYLSYLYFYGAIGASLLFIALFYLLKDSRQIGKKYGYWGTYYGIISFCIANTTLVYFNLSEMGIIISVIFLRYFSSLPEEQPLAKPEPELLETEVLALK